MVKPRHNLVPTMVLQVIPYDPNQYQVHGSSPSASSSGTPGPVYGSTPSPMGHHYHHLQQQQHCPPGGLITFPSPAHSSYDTVSQLFSFDPQTSTLYTPDGKAFNPFCSMEIVWHGEFDRLFAQYFPHQWFLMPTFGPPSERWRVFKDSAKVRFQCQECGHGWTSMKGRVVFWFHLNVATNSGYVLFKLYGQQCNRCKSERFEHAMWYPEEVIKVVGNVYNRVGQVYYGFYRPPLRIDRRPGKPRNQHNAELCQACKDGLCREEWTFS